MPANDEHTGPATVAKAQPWLLSSADDLSAGEVGLKWWEEEWGRTFPGAGSSYADKLGWCRQINEDGLIHDPEAGPRPCDEGNLIGRIIRGCCPSELTVQLLVKRSEVTGLQFDDASATTFLAATPAAAAESLGDALSDFKDELEAASEGLRPSYPVSPMIEPRAQHAAAAAAAAASIASPAASHGNLRVEHRGGYGAGLLATGSPQQRVHAYLNWLSGQQDTGTDLQEGDTELVCIANVLGVDKDTRNSNLVQDALRALGLHGCIDSLQPPLPTRFAGEDGAEDLYGLALDLRDTVGELLHFPSGRHGGGGGSCVALQLEPAEAGDGTAAVSAEQSAQASLRETRERTGKAYQVVDDKHVLWLPAAFDQEKERVRAHVNEGKGECEDIKRRLLTGDTDTGNLKLAMFKQELTAVNLSVQENNRTPAEQLCSCVAIALAFARDTWWMHDNSDPAAVVAVVSALADHLRTALLPLSDTELGLGAISESIFQLPCIARAGSATGESGSAAAAQEEEEEQAELELRASSRDALYALFEFCRRQFAGVGGGDHGPRVSFDYKPLAIGSSAAALQQVQRKKRAREEELRRRHGGFEVPELPPQRHRLLR